MIRQSTDNLIKLEYDMEDVNQFHYEEIPTCPECGVRTEASNFGSVVENHKCPACGYEMLVEYIPEECDSG